jgi:hypothetical protein
MSGAAECGSELLDEGAHEIVFLVDVVGVELADSKRSELGMVDALLNAFQGFGQGESQCHVEKRVRVFWADAGLSGAVGGVFNAE